MECMECSNLHGGWPVTLQRAIEDDLGRPLHNATLINQPSLPGGLPTYGDWNRKTHDPSAPSSAALSPALVMHVSAMGACVAV